MVFCIKNFLLWCILGSIGLFGCANFGSSPSQEDLDGYALSSQYRREEQRFVNPNQPAIDKMGDKVLSFSTIAKNLFAGEHLTPSRRLPEARPNLAVFADGGVDGSILWLGHSSFLIRLGGQNLLIDPVFGRAGPFPLFGDRFQNPVVPRDRLPTIDLVLISHDHYDHLEMDTVKYFRHKPTRFIVPLGVSRHLAYWGLEPQQITELDWWQSHRTEQLSITLTPAQHYSGRSGFLANDTLWGSFVIKSSQHALYFSGDSGYGQHFKQIGERYGPFDLAFLENGQYHGITRAIHMHPEDCIKAFRDLNTKALFPIHWGMFALARHPWYEPIQRLAPLAADAGIPLHVPRIGEVTHISQVHNSTDWWSSLVDEEQAR